MASLSLRRDSDHCLSSTMMTFVRAAASSPVITKSMRLEVCGSWYSIATPASAGISSSCSTLAISSSECFHDWISERTDAAARGAAEVPRHDVFDVVAPCVLEELGLAGLVDDHVRVFLGAHSSSYFLLLPRARSTGYFSSLSFSFACAAAIGSMPRAVGQLDQVQQHVRHLGSRRPRASRAQAARLCSSVSHWKCSSSSPASTTSADARFLGEWNCCQSRSCANRSSCCARSRRGSAMFI